MNIVFYYCFIVLFIINILPSYSQSESTDIKTDVIKTYSLHNQNKNNFVVNGEGRIYLKFQNDIIMEDLVKSLRGFRLISYRLHLLKKDTKTISFDPNNNKIIYSVDLNNNLLKTLDAGKNWLNIKNNIPNKIKLVSIKVSPLNTNNLYVETTEGVYYSNNAGFSWDKINFPGMIEDFIIDTKSDNRLFILSENTIYESSNNGTGWKKRFKLKLPKKRLANEMYLINDTEPFLLINAIEDLYRYELNKDKLINVSPLRNNDYNILYTSIYIDNSVIILGYVDGFYLSKDRGFSWEFKKVKTPSKKIFITGIAKDPQTNGYLFIDQQNQIFSFSEPDVTEGLNYGLQLNSNVIDLEISRSGEEVTLNALILNSNQLFLYNYAIWNSSDLGVTWEPTFVFDYTPPYNYPRKIHQKLFKSSFDERELTLIEFDQIYESKDGGKSWNKFALSNQHPYSNNNILGRAFDPFDRNISYFILGVNEIGLSRYDKSTNTSMNLKVQVGYQNGDVIVCKNNNKKILTSSLKLSTDGGWTWNDISKNVFSLTKTEPNDVGAINLLYFNSNKIIISLYNKRIYNYKYFILVSDDLGVTWRIIKSLRVGDRQDRFLFTYVNPENPSNIIMSYRSKENNKNYIDYTKNGGRKWDTIKILPTCDINFVKIIEDKNEQYIYLGSKCGALISENMGLSWKNLKAWEKGLRIK